MNKKKLIHPVPRFETEAELAAARKALWEFIDHPSSIAIGRKQDIDDNDVVYSPGRGSKSSQVIVDQGLMAVKYLRWRSRTALLWCLSKGPMHAFLNPAAELQHYLRCCKNTSYTVLTELRATGHAFRLKAHGNPGTKLLWKFSERPCGLPAAELRNAVFPTDKPQFAIHGKLALATDTPGYRPGRFRLGIEVARLDGIPPADPGW